MLLDCLLGLGKGRWDGGVLVRILVDGGLQVRNRLVVSAWKMRTMSCARSCGLDEVDSNGMVVGGGLFALLIWLG
jgi:hypothetical protein